MCMWKVGLGINQGIKYCFFCIFKEHSNWQTSMLFYLFKLIQNHWLFPDPSSLDSDLLQRENNLIFNTWHIPITSYMPDVAVVVCRMCTVLF